MKKIFLFFVFALALVGIIFALEKKDIISWRLEFSKKINDQIKIAFMDIGQGDAELITFPNGQTMLIDCGKDASILSALGRNLSWFKREIDYLVITHPHADHFGGCVDVLARYHVRHIYLNGYTGEHNAFLTTFFDAVSAEEKTGAERKIIAAPETLIIASTTINFLYPDHDLARDPRILGAGGALDTNDTSVVLALHYGTQDVLFTGDMEKPLEEYLVKNYPESLSAEVLKVGHHGSDSSSGENFVAAVKPRFCTISSGQGNSYGHPHGVTVRALARAGCEVLRTDERGDIVMNISTSSVQVVK